MATTIGIKLFYKQGTAGDTLAPIDSSLVTSINTQVLGVQNIPELQTAPSAIDTTSIEDSEEQSDPGLISGSSLGIVMNYKTGVYESGTEDKSNFEQCLSLASGKNEDVIHLWKIVFPSGRWFAFYAKARVTISAMAVASPLQFTLSLFKKSAVKIGYTAPSA